MAVSEVVGIPCQRIGLQSLPSILRRQRLSSTLPDIPPTSAIDHAFRFLTGDVLRAFIARRPPCTAMPSDLVESGRRLHVVVLRAPAGTGYDDHYYIVSHTGELIRPTPLAKA